MIPPVHRLRPAVPVAFVSALAAAALLSPPATAQPPGVSISTGSVDKRTGQAAIITARTTRIPRGARIVILGFRNGRRIVTSPCAVGQTVCRLRVSSPRAITVRFRAVIVLRGRVLRASRFLLVRWRPPPAPPPAPRPLQTVLRLTRVIPEGFPAGPGCGGGAPTGGGSHTVTLTNPGGDAVFRWTLPGELTTGANQASIGITASRNAQTQSLSTYTVQIRFFAGIAVSPPNAPTDLTTNGSLSQDYTFTPPASSFAEGAGLAYIRIHTSCGNLIYEYQREVR